MRCPAEHLEHDGIRLRRWRPDDADALLQAVEESMEHLSPWMVWATDGFNRTSAVEYLARSEADWRDGNAYNYAIIAPDGALAGSCGLMTRPGPGGLEIGYWLHQRHTGQGIATRAAAALTAEALRVGADRVEIVTDVANRRSAAVPQRLGFVEVQRRASEHPPAAARQGVEIVWRRRAAERPVG